MPSKSTAPTAYSYIRFSSGQQAEGHSLQRQTERAEEYCQRRGWRLDQALNLRDLGVPAFRGQNALNGNLGTFLTAIERRTVLPGSVLIVESFDRISRQGIDEGYEIVKRILKSDVRIVTLSPEREFDREATRSLSKGALEIQLILERAAEESERKSDRVGRAWAQKRREARNGVVMSERLPAWVCRNDDRLMLVPEAAAAVRRVFELATAGYGIPSIIRALDREGVEPIGRSGRWTRAYLSLILRDARVTGAYQPRRGKENDGAVVPDYYPPVVSEDQWLQARASVRERSRYRGRVGESGVNIFAGLLKNARPPHDNYAMTQRLSKSGGKLLRRYAVLQNAEGEQGRERLYSIPYLPFERAFLKCFREVKAADVLPGNGEADATAQLAAEAERVETELAEANAFMHRKGFSVSIGNRIATLEARQKQLAADQAEARQRAAHPLGEAWGQAVTLADVLDNAEDPRDTRLRLRSLLRSVIADMWVLVVPRGHHTLAAVQCDFVGGGVRHFLIDHARAGNGREERTEAKSRPAKKSAPLDLKRPKDVAELLRELEAAD